MPHELHYEGIDTLAVRDESSQPEHVDVCAAECAPESRLVTLTAHANGRASQEGFPGREQPKVRSGVWHSPRDTHAIADPHEGGERIARQVLGKELIIDLEWHAERYPEARGISGIGRWQWRDCVGVKSMWTATLRSAK